MCDGFAMFPVKFHCNHAICVWRLLYLPVVKCLWL
jgi:hypothetical protein